MGDVFSQLYPFVFAIGLAGYGPQLHKLWRQPVSARSMSISTWIIWASTWGISLGYGITKLDDLMFCLVAGMNLAAHIVIIGLIAYQKRDEFAQIFSVQILQPIYLRARK